MELSYTKKSIAPLYPVDLGGYGYYLDRVTDQVQEDIFVHILFLRHESQTVLIANFDLVGLSGYIVRRVKEQLQERMPCPVDQVMLFCTHTHTAPAVPPYVGCGVPDYGYQDFVVHAVVEAALEAARQTYPVTGLRHVEYEAQPMGYNRTGAQGAEDHHVYGTAFYAQGCAPYVILNYSCHPVTLGPVKLISADYPYYVLQELAARGYQGMFLNGCNGDIDPISNRDRWGSGSQAQLMAYGKQIVAGLEEALGKAQPAPVSALEPQNFCFSLPLQKIALRDIPALTARCKAAADGDRAMERAVDEWESRIRERCLRGLASEHEQVEIQLVHLGGCTLLALQGELYTELGMRLREKVAPARLLIGSNANASLRYIPSFDEAVSESYGGLLSCISDGVLPVAAEAMDVYLQAISDCFQGKGDFYG